MNSSRVLKYSYSLLPGICYLLEYIIWKSFDPSKELNGVLGGLWTTGQIGILMIVVDINSNGTTANDRWSRAGAIVTSIGALCYICNYVFGYWLAFNTRIFLPMGAVFTGLGMTIVGYRVLKARRWTGITAYAPLFVGLYPFIIMFPLVVITGHPDINAILGWGIPWFILGITMIKHKMREAPSTDGTL